VVRKIKKSIQKLKNQGGLPPAYMAGNPWLAAGVTSVVYPCLFKGQPAIKKECRNDGGTVARDTFLHDLRVHRALLNIQRECSTCSTPRSTRSKRSTGRPKSHSAATDVDVARVPEIYNFSDRHVVMERLSGTVHYLMVNTESAARRRRVAVRVMRQLSALLARLQRRCQFLHRDLHASNVMYTVMDRKSEWNCPVSRLQFYLIDFGYSQMRWRKKLLFIRPILHLERLQRRLTYDRRFNSKHDLTTLVLCMRDYFGEDASDVPRFLADILEQFFKCALRSRAYTVEGRDVLNIRRPSLGFNPGGATEPPTFWFAYGATAHFRSLCATPRFVLDRTQKIK